MGKILKPKMAVSWWFFSWNLKQNLQCSKILKFIIWIISYKMQQKQVCGVSYCISSNNSHYYQLLSVIIKNDKWYC